MRFFALFFELVLASSLFAQNDSVAILNKKVDQIQYQFYMLQAKVGSIDQDFRLFKNLSSDSMKMLMQYNEALSERIEDSEAKLQNQASSLEILEKTQSTQGELLLNFLWISALALLIIAGVFVFLFINNRKRLNSQRDLLERLFMNNLKTLEMELKEITTANREKSIALETQINTLAEKNSALKEDVSKNRSQAEKEHKKLEEAIVLAEKELNKILGTLKQKITKNEIRFLAADKSLSDSIKKNEKVLKEKVDKLKANVKKDYETLLKKLNTELKKSSEQAEVLKKEIKKIQKRNTVTFQVKKSG